MQDSERTQLDLFLDSQTVILGNELIAALLARDASAAAGKLEALRAYAPDARNLAALELLTRVLADWRVPAAECASIAAAARRLDEEVAPAARRALGAQADGFVAAFFRQLAAAARDLAYDPAHPVAYGASLCLRCGDWAAAEAAACAIARSDETPDALHWLALARQHSAGTDAARATLFALAWHAPQRVVATLAELDDELLDRDWRAFERACDWDSVDETELPAWFPAWYVLEHPAAGRDLAGVRAPADCAPAKAAQLLLWLLDLEQRGDQHALVSRRAQLRELNAEFFALYMARRAVRHR